MQVRIASDPSSFVVSTAEGAKFLGVSDQTIRNMSRIGLIEPVARGLWNLTALFKAREAQLKAIADEATKNSAASRATDARTREIELRIARQERRLIPLDEVQDMFDEVVGLFITSLSSLPTRITRNKRERDRIDRIIDQERTRLADEFGKKAVQLESNEQTQTPTQRS